MPTFPSSPITKVERLTPITSSRVGLLAPDAVRVCDLVVCVREQGERQVVLLLELRVRGLAVRAHPEDDRSGALELAPASRIPHAWAVQPGVSSLG